MNKKLIRKCFITLGLLLFFTLLVPFLPLGNQAAKAASIDKEKSYDYKLNVKSTILVKGKTYQLRVYNLLENTKVSFKSDDSEIANVADDGTVTANKVGVTNITVTMKDGTDSTYLTCEITVGPPAFSVKITRSRIILGLDKTDLLRVILKPSNTAEDASFSSKNPAIASVSSIGGRVTANGLGLTYLFAKIDVKYAYCTVIVTSPDNAPLLEEYFNNHSELDMIPESDLLNALELFFNGKSDVTPTIAPKADSASLVDTLNQALESEFNLKALRKTREEAFSNLLQN